MFPSNFWGYYDCLSAQERLKMIEKIWCRMTFFKLRVARKIGPRSVNENVVQEQSKMLAEIIIHEYN